MCGRARCTLRREDVPAACGFQAPLRTLNAENFRSSYNVSPGSYMPVLRYDQEGDSKSPLLHYMKWGLIPSFTKKSEHPDHFRMFNARSESIHEKASFRRLIPKHRCLAVVEGFYEWKKDGTKKQPYYVHLNDGQPLVFAALFDCWTNIEGEALYTFTIVTTRSSKALSWLHDRMPVILGNQQAIYDWLNVDLPLQSLQAVMQPYELPGLAWYPVTPAMGKTSYDGPECVKQLKIGGQPRNSLIKLFGKHETKTELIVKEEDMKDVAGSMMSKKELKEFLAGLRPDEDSNLQMTEIKVEPEVLTLSGIAVESEEAERDTDSPKTGKTERKAEHEVLTPSKKRKSPEPVGKPKAKAAPTSPREGQKSLLTFFRKP